MRNQLFGRTGHVCRTCLGPVLSGEGGFVCAVCDATGVEVEAICGCGIHLPGEVTVRVYHCSPNPARGPRSPGAAVIAFGPEAATA
jgi:hypothetical protein